MKYYQDTHCTIYNGNALEILPTLEAESIQTVITSPPYWGLRKYSGYQDYIWDNHSKCIEHIWETRQDINIGIGGSDKQNSNAGSVSYSSSSYYCRFCGAWKGAFGLEPTPELYISHSMEFLRAIKRILRKDGCIFWNLGDSYWGGKGQSGQGSPEYQAARQDVSLNKPYHQIGGQKQTRPSDATHPLIKPKDLCLIPFHFAIEAQKDGWWIRSVIIWAKPNPMPESVKDRPTESHEYIFLLTKSKSYYWDIEAVREPSIDEESYTGRRPRNINTIGIMDPEHYAFMGSVNENGKLKFGQTYPNRNIRTVWEITTQPFKDAHFATFPEDIPRRCILASTKQDSLVLDPFSGSGTTGMVAKQLNRRSILIDTSEDYCRMAQHRLESASIPMELM